MATDERDDKIDIPDDLAEALRENPEAAAIWAELSAAHRRGHVIAIERITHAKERADRIQHTIEHLFEKHAE